MNKSEVEREKTKQIYWKFIESSLTFLNYQDKSLSEDFERLWLQIQDALKEDNIIINYGNYFTTQHSFDKIRKEMRENE